MTAQKVFDTLIKEDKILEISGQIKFFLGDVKIIVKQKDVVGNIMQEWLEGWLKKRNVSYSVNPNTQMPPDFFLSPKDHKRNLLEIKAFNSDASPGFDIADFTMYSEEIIREPYMLDVDYLIFGYQMSDEGFVIGRSTCKSRKMLYIKSGQGFGTRRNHVTSRCSLVWSISCPQWKKPSIKTRIHARRVRNGRIVFSRAIRHLPESL